MPKIYPKEIKQKALQFRRNGYTYTEIRELIHYSVAKSTFSEWFKNITLSQEAKKRIALKIEEAGSRGRGMSWLVRRHKRKIMIEGIQKRIASEIIQPDKLTAKIVLSMLYLAEGAKAGEFIRFGNSDPKIIEVFLKCLRSSFSIDETRLRGRVQCRADQNINDLEHYWSEKTGIPIKQFQKPFKDPRTLGKPTKKENYKGVFVVIYCSNAIFLELKFISDIIYTRVVGSGPVV